ncbi:MAG TPA: macro domain-containing protein [Polyangiaceae bacterium]|nr:macro domain-containing protein [Polyangiaceae bacterium]
MPTIFMKGDIFDTEGLHAFAHGCDTAGAMDAGVAVAFKKRWPAMFEEYRARCADRTFRVGDVFAWSEGEENVFILGIQEQSAQKAKVTWLTKSLQTMTELAAMAGIERVGIPRIGAGQAGLDWPRVKKILTEAGRTTSVTLVVFEQFIRRPATPS